ncbi:hypothetical protein MRX96_008295 [Rhipicephalus microplus]
MARSETVAGTHRPDATRLLLRPTKCARSRRGGEIGFARRRGGVRERTLTDTHATTARSPPLPGQQQGAGDMACRRSSFLVYATALVALPQLLGKRWSGFDLFSLSPLVPCDDDAVVSMATRV